MATASRMGFGANKRVRIPIGKAAAMPELNPGGLEKGTALSADHQVLMQHQTVLSDRDRDIFLAMLDADAKPNAALKKAAKAYAKAFGR